MLNFVALGHSHIVSLAKGAYALQAQGAGVAGSPAVGHFHYLYDESYLPDVQEGPNGPILNRKIAAALEAGDPRFVLLSVGGNEHNVLSIAQPVSRYDFVLGEAPDLPVDEAAQLIPEMMMRETIREWMSKKIAVMKAIRRATSLPTIQVEPPPPVPREQVLAYPKEFFRKTVDLRKLSPDSLRYKMWRLQSDLYVEICAELDVAYVTTPPDLIGPGGMLPKMAWSQDATHANEHFGERMMGEVFRRAESMLERTRV